MLLELDLTGGAQWDDILILMCSALVLGALLALTFAFTHRKSLYDKSFMTTLILLPIVISMIILLVNNDIARAFSLAGVFALVRFRTAIADSRDITYILSTVAIALAMSLGYLGFGIIITAFICLVFLVLHFIKLDKEKTSHSKLQIVIPENLDYTDAFKDVFEKYLTNYQLQKVKTTDFGSLFELTYLIKLKNGADQKCFIDELRVKNSNLNITIINEYAALMVNDQNNS